MFATLILFAQEEGKKAAEGPPWYSALVWILPLIFLFYFLMFRPQQQQQKRLREQLSALKKNDKIVTHSGIIGVVTNIGDNDVTIRLEEGRVKIIKTAVARILSAEEEVEAEKKA